MLAKIKQKVRNRNSFLGLREARHSLPAWSTTRARQQGVALEVPDPTSGQTQCDQKSIYEPFKGEEFVYKPLNINRRQIRLLQIWWSSEEGIECHIHHFDIEDAPRYRALSYTWGQGATKDIRIDGGLFHVRENLFEFLTNYVVCYSTSERELCDAGNGVWLWVDQLSIHQESVTERNHQVQMMEYIYRGADEVLVWLGLDWRCAAALDLIRSINEMAPEARPRPSELTPRQRTELDALFDCNYWQRIWIVQEIKLARQCTLLIGQDRFSKDDLLTFCQSRLSARHACSQVEWILGSEPSTLARTLYHTRTSKCSDLRDKVYGIQSLFEPEERLQVDYNKSSEHVFLEASERLLDRWSLWYIQDQGESYGYTLELIYTLGIQMNVIVHVVSTPEQLILGRSWFDGYIISSSWSAVGDPAKQRWISAQALTALDGLAKLVRSDKHDKARTIYWRQFARIGRP